MIKYLEIKLKTVLVRDKKAFLNQYLREKYLSRDLSQVSFEINLRFSTCQHLKSIWRERKFTSETYKKKYMLQDGTIIRLVEHILCSQTAHV